MAQLTGLHLQGAGYNADLTMKKTDNGKFEFQMLCQKAEFDRSAIQQIIAFLQEALEK